MSLHTISFYTATGHPRSFNLATVNIDNVKFTAPVLEEARAPFVLDGNLDKFYTLDPIFFRERSRVSIGHVA